MIVRGNLDVRYLEDADGHPTENRQLLSALSIRWRNNFFSVPKGFITDFASIPAVVRIFVHKGGGIERAATVHDALYRTPALPFTRAEADRLFLDIMEEDDIRFTRRWVIYSGVRAGGWASFQKRLE